jgi:hypothetical protein
MGLDEQRVAIAAASEARLEHGKGKSGYTTSQKRMFAKDADAAAADGATNGAPPDMVYGHLIAMGCPPSIALRVMRQYYPGYGPNVKGPPAPGSTYVPGP